MGNRGGGYWDALLLLFFFFLVLWTGIYSWRLWTFPASARLSFWKGTLGGKKSEGRRLLSFAAKGKCWVSLYCTVNECLYQRWGKWKKGGGGLHEKRDEQRVFCVQLSVCSRTRKNAKMNRVGRSQNLVAYWLLASSSTFKYSNPTSSLYMSCYMRCCFPRNK